MRLFTTLNCQMQIPSVGLGQFPRVVHNMQCYAPINCMPHSPPPGQRWGMRGRFSLFCYKMWPRWWGVCLRPFSIVELKHMDIYLMVFSSLCVKLFSLHCMGKRWLSSFYMQTIQSSVSTLGEGWGFAMKICPGVGEFH